MDSNSINVVVQIVAGVLVIIFNRQMVEFGVTLKKVTTPPSLAKARSVFVERFIWYIAGVALILLGAARLYWSRF